MPKTRVAVTIDEEVLRAVEVRAARQGTTAGEVVEEALRRDLGFDLLDRLCQRDDLDEDVAGVIAVKAQHAARRAQPDP